MGFLHVAILSLALTIGKVDGTQEPFSGRTYLFGVVYPTGYQTNANQHTFYVTEDGRFGVRTIHWGGVYRAPCQHHHGDESA